MIFSTISQIAQVVGMSGALMTTPVGLPVQCRINKAPRINIRPQTKAIQYDLDTPSAELTAKGSNTISPYGIEADTITGGLRHDHPLTKTSLSYHYIKDPRSQTICMAYNEITLEVILQPKIYIAEEFNRGRCAVEVLEHEKKHVKVDRQVINKYTKLMGKAIQQTVNQVGIVGPFPISREENMKKMMSSNIQNAISSVELAMLNEMNYLQQQVDSRAEYDRIGQYCESASKRVIKNRERTKR